MAAGVGTVAVLAPIPPTRKLLLKAKSPGEGPSAATRAGSWFKIRFVGEGGGKRVVTEVSGGDPGYSETSKMLAECGPLPRLRRPPRARRSTHDRCIDG